ncbi:MAG: hypothetical protein ACQEQL_01235 [Pseudomonadota bacterium]
MKNITSGHFSLISMAEIKSLWLEKGSFIPYPDILKSFVDQKAKIEGWPDLLTHIGLDISSKIKRVDSSTGLAKPDHLPFNRSLIEEYLQFQKENPHQLEELQAVRIWGDITNMGGINIALSLEDEEQIDPDKSIQGIKRANKFIRLVTEVIKTRLNEIGSINSINLYREGGDEIGGYLLLDKNHSFNDVKKAIEHINDDVEETSAALQLSNIVHRKAPEDPERMGGGFVCAAAIANFKNPAKPQFELEQQVELKKTELAAARAVKYGGQMRRKIPEDVIHNVTHIFYDIVREKQIDITDVMDAPLIIDKEAMARHAVPALARKKYISEYLNSFPDHESLGALFDGLLDAYSQNRETGIYNLEDVNRAIMGASRNFENQGYFIIAQQTNLGGINKAYGHEFCDRVIEKLTKGIKDAVDQQYETGMIRGEYGVFNVEVHQIASKNALAVILQTDKPSDIPRLINDINEHTRSLVTKAGLDDLPHPTAPDRSGVSFVFGAQKIPRSVFHPGIAQKIVSDVKKQAEYNEEHNIVFDPKGVLSTGAYYKNAAHNRRNRKRPGFK